MGADLLFYLKTIETNACAFLPLNISAIGTVMFIILPKKWFSNEQFVYLFAILRYLKVKMYQILHCGEKFVDALVLQGPLLI